MIKEEFAIIANPKSGSLSVDSKLRILKPASKVFGASCDIVGLDAASLDDLCGCAAKVAETGKIVVIASGDTTFIPLAEAAKNAGGPETVVAYLPLGTGNAVWYALNTPLFQSTSLFQSVFYEFNVKESLQQAARKIKAGKVHDIDLISCDGKGALLASVGIEGQVINEYERILKKERRFQTSREGRFYAHATALRNINADQRFDRPDMAEITLNGNKKQELKNPLSIIVTKIPYYGLGMKVMPKANISDGQLHVRLMNQSLFEYSGGLAMSFLGVNPVGKYLTASNVRIETDKSVYLQADGGVVGEKKTKFEFKVLPGELKLRY
jgi:diacylglycerol kinase (ATP)